MIHTMVVGILLKYANLFYNKLNYEKKEKKEKKVKKERERES
jgi:hypothetical protein